MIVFLSWFAEPAAGGAGDEGLPGESPHTGRGGGSGFIYQRTWTCPLGFRAYRVLVSVRDP